ncbi:triple gene block 3 protein [Hippeastrum latent virus]|uniref:Movement protein TGBp3 n=1 Tax=Hippeastrum latent virus TaxID=335963 RepID=Q4F975_9VIRU|nr:triple gene block 3 protein [Hippeastrum latent virus]AAZ15109.1 triple gene block 3 protein [Hippeastrum latent virus]
MREYFFIGITAFIITIVLLLLCRGTPCVVVITGESVRVHNCVVSPGLFDSIAKLRPFRE